MRGPPFPHTVTIRTPGAPTVDPGTNNPIPAAPTAVVSTALLQQLGTVETAGSTVLADWFVLLPNGTVITSVATVTGQGRLFQVSGSPAQMESLTRGPIHLEVKLKFVSDLQE